MDKDQIKLGIILAIMALKFKNDNNISNLSKESIILAIMALKFI